MKILIIYEPGEKKMIEKVDQAVSMQPNLQIHSFHFTEQRSIEEYCRMVMRTFVSEINQKDIILCPANKTEIFRTVNQIFEVWGVSHKMEE